MVRAFIVVWLIEAAAFAQSPSTTPREIPVRIQLPNSQLTDIVKLYQSLTKRKVWIDAELRFDRKISIFTQRDLPRAEALSLIRGTLLNEGIEIREVGDAEAFVSRSSDSRIESLKLPSSSFPASLSPSPTPRVRGVTQRPSPSP